MTCVVIMRYSPCGDRRYVKWRHCSCNKKWPFVTNLKKYSCQVHIGANRIIFRCSSVFPSYPFPQIPANESSATSQRASKFWQRTSCKKRTPHFLAPNAEIIFFAINSTREALKVYLKNIGDSQKTVQMLPLSTTLFSGLTISLKLQYADVNMFWRP